MCFIYWNLILRVGLPGSKGAAVRGLRDDGWQRSFTCDHVFGIKPPTCLEGMEQRQNFCLCCSRVVVSGKSILGFLHLLPSVVPPLLHPTSRLVVNFDMHDIKTSFIWRWIVIHLFRRKLCHAVSVKGRKSKVSVLGNFTDAQVLGLISVEIINTHQSSGSAAPYRCGVAGTFNIWMSWIFQIGLDFAAEVVALLPAFQCSHQTCQLGDGEALHGVLEQSWVKRFGSRLLPVLGSPGKTPAPLALDSEYLSVFPP